MKGKLIRKLVAVSLCAVMAAGLMAGCGSSAESSDAAASAEESTEDEAEAAEDEAEATEEAAEPEAEGEAAETPEGGMPENGTLVYLSRALGDEFGSMIAYDLQGQMAEKYPGWTVSIQNSDNDPSKQLEFMENAIINDVDVLVVQSVADANCLQAAKDAIDAGIFVMCYEVPFSEEEDVCPLVFSDFYTSYHVLMDYAVENVPENANICVLSGIQGFGPTVEREKALNEFLEARPDVNVLATQYANYETDQAMNITEDWMQQFDNIDGILCLTDTMAIGVCEAYRANNMDSKDIWVCGVDSLSDACGYIETGELTVSVFRSPRAFSNAAITAIEKYYDGTQDMLERILCNNDIIVTKDNVAEIEAELAQYE